jgi:hypothetical protein
MSELKSEQTTMKPEFYELINLPVQATTTDKESVRQITLYISLITPISSIINLQTSKMILTNPFMVKFSQLSGVAPQNIPEDALVSNAFISYAVSVFKVN